MFILSLVNKRVIGNFGQAYTDKIKVVTSKGNKGNVQPFLIKENKANELKQIHLKSNEYNEDWIQELIHNNPNILPINQIDIQFTDAVSIGREIRTVSGPIDNLLISPEGYLTIVETKLWRNPEARRKVVGQILDYAKEVNKWTFDDLDGRVRQFNKDYNNNSDGLWATVRNFCELEEQDEKFFHDKVNKNLQDSRFLLLIVGDGITENVEDIVGYLNQTPQLNFTLALVELNIYKLNDNDNSLIVIPQIVTRTKEIIRAIIRIEGTYPKEKVFIEVPTEEEVLPERDFYDQLARKTDKKTVEFARQIKKDCEDLGLDIDWMAASFTARLPDPAGSDIRVPIINVDKRGNLNLGLSRPSIRKLQLPLEISHRFATDTAKMFKGIKPKPNREHIWDKDAKLGELQNVYPEFMKRLREYIEDISNEREKSSR